MAGAATSDPKRRAAHEPLYDADVRTAPSVDVIYSARTLVSSGGLVSVAVCQTASRLVHSLRATPRTATR